MPTDTNPYCAQHHMNQRAFFFIKPFKKHLKRPRYVSETNFHLTFSSFPILIFTKLLHIPAGTAIASGKTALTQYRSEVAEISRHEYTSTALASGFILW